MQLKILIVEDDKLELVQLKSIAKSCHPTADILLQDSFQGVINDVINQKILPDCAIVDMAIFEKSDSNRGGAESPDVSWGDEMVTRLCTSGMPESGILAFTVFPQNVERRLKNAGYTKIQVLDKATYPTMRTTMIEKFLMQF